jgi:DNA polymerase-1
MAKAARQTLLPGMDPQPSDPAPQQAAPAASAEQPPEVPQLPTHSLPAADAPASLAGQSVWVVDANSLIFQVFHALPEMTSPQGEPVSAVFGFARDMLYLLEEKKPTYFFVALDGPERTFRHDLYENYKGTRTEMPVDLVPQFAPIGRLLDGLNVPGIAVEGFEADDLLATIAHQTHELGGECFIVSADKDCRQLITDRVKVYNVRKDQLYDAAALAADWGIRPDQVVDFQALVGDSVDNVPGVPLIGPKIAAEYLQKYETLDNLLAHVDELPKGKRRDNLSTMRDQALLSRELVRLDRHVPVHVPWDAARVNGVQREALETLFSELGFRGLKEKRAIGSRGTKRSTRPSGWRGWWTSCRGSRDSRSTPKPRAFRRAGPRSWDIRSPGRTTWRITCR